MPEPRTGAASGGARTRITWIVLVVAAVAVLGALAGRFVASSLRSPAPETHAPPGATLKLAVGQSFPDHGFLDLNGVESTVAQLVRGKKAVVLCLSTTCKPCETVVARWGAAYAELSPDVEVLAISSEPEDVLRQFRIDHDMPFEVYRDEAAEFLRSYGVDALPAVFGLRADGEIAFIDFGADEEDVERYLAQL